MSGREKLLIVLAVLAGGVWWWMRKNMIPADEVRVQKLAEAIARQEGFFVSGSRPARNHNPGNLTKDLIGRAVGKDGAFSVFATDADGWDNLRALVRLMLNGGSQIYNPDMTIAQVSSFYTSTQRAEWAANVASILGVSVDTKISAV